MSYPPQAPWTGIGSLQSEVQDIRSALHGKADKHEIHSLDSRLASVERSLGEISASCDGLSRRLETIEAACRVFGIEW